MRKFIPGLSNPLLSAALWLMPIASILCFPAGMTFMLAPISLYHYILRSVVTGDIMQGSRKNTICLSSSDI